MASTVDERRLLGLPGAVVVGSSLAGAAAIVLRALVAAADAWRLQYAAPLIGYGLSCRHLLDTVQACCEQRLGARQSTDA